MGGGGISKNQDRPRKIDGERERGFAGRFKKEQEIVWRKRRGERHIGRERQRLRENKIEKEREQNRERERERNKRIERYVKYQWFYKTIQERTRNYLRGRREGY